MMELCLVSAVEHDLRRGAPWIRLGLRSGAGRLGTPAGRWNGRGFPSEFQKKIMSDGLWPSVRFAREAGDPGFAGRVLARVAGGETLREIARSLGLPRTQFLMWVAANGDLSEACLRVRELSGVELRYEGLEIVDGATVETVAVCKLQADYRRDLSRDLNKPLFGKLVSHQHTVGKDWGDRLRRARERVIEVEVLPSEVPSVPELVDDGIL